MATELELYIQERLGKMQDYIEIVSFYQRKMQITDEALVRQTTRINQFDQMLRTNEAEDR